MAPTALPTTTRYIPQGTSRYYWVPAIASISAPTRLEIDAGTDLTCEVAALAGFMTTAGDVDAPDACSRFVGKVPGLITADDSSINFYSDEEGDDVHSFFTRDQIGFVLILPGGDVAARKMDVWPARVKSVSRVQTLDAAQQIVVQFSITRDPAVNVDIPA